MTYVLQWNAHIDNTISKVSRRIYFLVQLERANGESKNLVKFYITCIRSAVEYCWVVLLYSLPDYNHVRLERVQIRCLSIIYRQASYEEALKKTGLLKLKLSRENLVVKLFKFIMSNEQPQLYCLLPNQRQCSYNLRKENPFILPRFNTNRNKNTFILANIYKLNW